MTEKDIKLENAHILYGDALDRLKELPDNSIDSIVTDPPYGLSDNKHVATTIEKWITGDRSFIPDGKGFMGKAWDSFVPPPAIWDECLRVLKPGGHLLAFFGSRTQDIGALSIRLAGFEIRDSIAWVYGSGFPKSLDISKALDKQAGAEREVVGVKVSTYKVDKRVDNVLGKYDHKMNEDGYKTDEITAPSTPAAKQYSGWGTALKPAVEPIVVARKPLSEKTVANNVLKWGTGGLNIDASRVAYNGDYRSPLRANGELNSAGLFGAGVKDNYDIAAAEARGRFPANIILDEEAAKVLDEQSGVSKSTGGSINKGGLKSWVSSLNAEDKSRRFNEAGNAGFGDIGGASRFFYIAKASKKDRHEGMTDANNNHPTVKPTKLMEYLIKLVTPVDGVVLDPFTGSGSTGKAALLNGFKFIGCELTEEYLPIIEGRLKFAANKYAETQAKKAEEAAESLFDDEEN